MDIEQKRSIALIGWFAFNTWLNRATEKELDGFAEKVQPLLTLAFREDLGGK